MLHGKINIFPIWCVFYSGFETDNNFDSSYKPKNGNDLFAYKFCVCSIFCISLQFVELAWPYHSIWCVRCAILKMFFSYVVFICFHSIKILCRLNRKIYSGICWKSLFLFCNGSVWNEIHKENIYEHKASTLVERERDWYICIQTNICECL